MPHSFFILSRLFVRVDNVLFRIHDVRIYHSFGTSEIVKEVSGMEVGYDQIKRVSLRSKTRNHMIIMKRRYFIDKKPDFDHDNQIVASRKTIRFITIDRYKLGISENVIPHILIFSLISRQCSGTK